MPKYVIEREVPGVGTLTADEQLAIWAKSNQVLSGMDGRAQWVQSYVTQDKLYCVYLAESAEALYEHAQCGGFPIDSVAEVLAVVDPTSGE